MPVYTEYNSTRQYGILTGAADYCERENTHAVAFIRGHNKKLFFSKGTGLHRTDGPARIVWLDTGGTESRYYINNEEVPEQLFKKVLNAPIEDLPLYFNIKGLKEIAVDRLKGEKTTVISSKETLFQGWKLIT